MQYLIILDLKLGFYTPSFIRMGYHLERSNPAHLAQDSMILTFATICKKASQSQGFPAELNVLLGLGNSGRLVGSIST